MKFKYVYFLIYCAIFIKYIESLHINYDTLKGNISKLTLSDNSLDQGR